MPVVTTAVKASTEHIYRARAVMTGRIRTWDEAVRIRRDSRRGIVHSHPMAIAESDRVAETTQEPVDATIWESAAVASLHALNTESVRAFADSDMTWYEDHLSDHFVCTRVDGQRIDKADFLERARQRSSARDVRVRSVTGRLACGRECEERVEPGRYAARR